MSSSVIRIMRQLYMRLAIIVLDACVRNMPVSVIRIMRQLYMRPAQPMRWFLSRLFVLRMRKMIFELKDNENSVDFAFRFWVFPFLPVGVFSIHPAQIRVEVERLLKILSQLQPKYVMEIGTAYGGMLFLFTSVASSVAKIISVDLPWGPFGGGYPEWKIPVYLSFAKANQKIYLLREDSHDTRTLNKVKSILGDKKLDFLFIDGDHSYEGVKKDFEMYAPLVRKGGIIAFHDIVPDYLTRYGLRTSSATGGVPKFWREIKHNYKHREIVQDYNQDGYGIGIIWWELS